MDCVPEANPQKGNLLNHTIVQSLEKSEIKTLAGRQHFLRVVSRDA